MIAWMLYSAVVAIIVAAAARSAEWLARSIGYRVRWAWLGAIVVATVLSLAALVRSVAPSKPREAVGVDVAAPTATASTIQATWSDEVRANVLRARQAVIAPFVETAMLVRRRVPLAVDRVALGSAAVSSILIFALLVVVTTRFYRARQRWPRALLHGVHVRVAPSVGPVVLGVVRPEIVVPRWLTTRSDDEQRMVLAHESEHLRAGDPFLLGVAWVAVAIAPWSPALWYMLARLRLAIELDCDARVLRRGAAPRAYGTLLIDVAQQASGLGASALALAAENSHLHQRILAMKPTRPSFVPLRAVLAATFSFGALLTACAAALPTDADVAAMDAASATRAAAQIMSDSGAMEYYVDGHPVSAAQAMGIQRIEIAAVEVEKGQHAQIRITRKVIGDTAIMVTGHPMVASADTFRIMPDSSRVRLRGARASTENFTGVLLVDGVRTDAARMNSIDPKTIAQIQVLKGPAAVAQYGEDAKNGAIIITTKR